jgi:nicotinate-nucleotide pyrophosphorylase (carboxylating)
LDSDVTSAAVIPRGDTFEGVVVVRAGGVVCGLPVAARAWEFLAAACGMPDAIDVFPLVAEGSLVEPGTAVLEVTGDTRLVLAGERTALNLLMTLSGIATEARRWQDAAGAVLRVSDTRKTLPSLRELSKYAVAVGGAYNHRVGLWDRVLIKDNHLARAGSVRAAVDAARAAHPELRIEVEADSMQQAVAAATAGADIIMLDNMDDAAVAAAVDAVRAACPEGHQCEIEVSGNVTIERLPALAAIGVDVVSTSALTLARPLDVGFDERRGAGAAGER